MRFDTLKQVSEAYAKLETAKAEAVKGAVFPEDTALAQARISATLATIQYAELDMEHGIRAGHATGPDFWGDDNMRIEARTLLKMRKRAKILTRAASEYALAVQQADCL